MPRLDSIAIAPMRDDFQNFISCQLSYLSEFNSPWGMVTFSVSKRC